jgi:hypothetical protein
MNHDTTLDRRHFLGGMVTAVAASQLGVFGFAGGDTRTASRRRARRRGGSSSWT